mmetsp:Transcript_17028/g.14925  ORF Transcript_17028/g.14925 Transcript_17028/m.14925 type:complete len:183 (-) Transcript_17028:1041-1589(-)
MARFVDKYRKTWEGAYINLRIKSEDDQIKSRISRNASFALVENHSKYDVWIVKMKNGSAKKWLQALEGITGYDCLEASKSYTRMNSGSSTHSNSIQNILHQQNSYESFGSEKLSTPPGMIQNEWINGNNPPSRNVNNGFGQSFNNYNDFNSNISASNNNKNGNNMFSGNQHFNFGNNNFHPQ